MRRLGRLALLARSFLAGPLMAGPLMAGPLMAGRLMSGLLLAGPVMAWAQSPVGSPVAAEPPMPQLEAPPRPAGVTDAIIRQAVRDTIAEDPQPLQAPGQGATALSGGVTQARLNAAFDQAKVPDCLHGDALKHQPAHIGPIAVVGIYSLPWVMAAVVRGKCN